ncbi:hypothetical protein AB1Y20_000900 [Prymnesium parvum]|uniref:Methyltransferase type 11 domain-containing protein n=1 Tax=Prymnesium parvum TaxID=97485 RepID=A0AB34K9P7_PRYPA
MSSRPERRGAAQQFYSTAEAAKYDASARMAQTQRHLADRALHLLDLPPDRPALLLDCGCGTGYSGAPLARAGHTWLGVDVSEPMLRAARAARPTASLLAAVDLGRGLPFRKGSFDGAISISAVQWLCQPTREGLAPATRVRKFFVGLHAVLAPGARAVLQFYPEAPSDVEMLREAAGNAGFAGGLVVDYPWSERSKKLFLVLVKANAPPSMGGAPSVGAASRKAKPGANGRKGGMSRREGKQPRAHPAGERQRKRAKKGGGEQ